MPYDRDLALACKRFLLGHPPRTQRQWLDSLAQSAMADLQIDTYGEGPAISIIESEVAAVLGKESAVFLHKGVVAQQCALRVWTDQAGTPNVALHPQSHIHGDEADAYQRLHNLRGITIGKPWIPFTIKELEAITEPLGAIVVELPLRRAGYKLPTWDELVTISEWARTKQVALHFDGARLWEAAPYYGRTYAEIAALADSVYVSFYKGLGALAGCVLAGTSEFIANCRPWKTRMGGNIFRQSPYIIAAYEGMRHHVPKMEGYYRRACEIAAALQEALPVQIAPNPPQCNAFQLFLPAAIPDLEQAANIIAEQDKEWFLGFLTETQVPSQTMTEVVIGEAAESWTTAEIVAAFSKLLRLAKGR